MKANYENISNTAKDNLKSRLNNSENYSIHEIDHVTLIDVKLIDHSIDNDTTDILRELCRSYTITKSLRITKSHRPVIGPVIYFSKKILSKIITPFLRTQFDQIESFNRNAVHAIAKLYNKSEHKK